MIRMRYWLVILVLAAAALAAFYFFRQRATVPPLTSAVAIEEVEDLRAKYINEMAHRMMYETWLNYRIPNGTEEAMQYVQVVCDNHYRCLQRFMFTSENPPGLPGVAPTGKLKYY